MNFNRRLVVFALALAAAEFVAGCAHPARVAQRGATAAYAAQSEELSPSLVMMPGIEKTQSAASDNGSDAAAELSDFDYGRNDWRLGTLGGQDLGGIELLEIRHREFLRTIDGRTRDFSSTFTETIKRRLTR